MFSTICADIEKISILDWEAIYEHEHTFSSLKLLQKQIYSNQIENVLKIRYIKTLWLSLGVDEVVIYNGAIIKGLVFQ